MRRFGCALPQRPAHAYHNDTHNPGYAHHPDNIDTHSSGAVRSRSP